MEVCKKRSAQKILSIALLLVVLTLSGCGTKHLEQHLDAQVEKTANYILEQTPDPKVAPIGGEWAIKGIKASGIKVPEHYFELYYDHVRAQAKLFAGQIHETYYSDYARVAIGLSAIAKSMTDVEGYDLTQGMKQEDELCKQGLHAVAYTLVGLRETGTSVEQEQAYVSFLQKEMGQMLSKDCSGKADFIAAGLIGLSFYADESRQVIRDGIEVLSHLQEKNGSMGSLETTAETIVALTQLGVDVFHDERFQKDGNSLGDSLLLFVNKDGSFRHTQEKKEANAMATEKALLALDAMKLWKQGSTLYSVR